ncbi:non-hydrolyzing UDP-N-acetylglucosamine 2-epimerase [Thalassospira lucentensis]|uniref:non-hydrolyzing UDP-N-acetylglucosamine 2-epimerase n=1 Tax=Thalassospira lucentensis TaxID=168935 RepID=UPI0034C6D3E7
MMSDLFVVSMVFGTRPEAIKMAPLAAKLRENSNIKLHICSTGQHREMLTQVLDAFDLQADEDLDVMTSGQTLNGLSQLLLTRLDRSFEQTKPDIVLVHGDTTTSFMAAFAAFNRRIPVAHVEAGLRTGNIHSPWPEEANRALTAVLANLHFAPTERDRNNLLEEGVDPSQIEVTGNTVIDALLLMRDKLTRSGWTPDVASPLGPLNNDRRVVLITGHRRESFGDGFHRICTAIADLADRNPDVMFVYPVHLNPVVQEAVYGVLDDKPNVLLVPPQGYLEFVWLMNRASIILTDSGGVQEEAPALGRPVLVLRDVTERPSGADSASMMVGTDHAKIVSAVQKLLDDPDYYREKSQTRSPFGDGHASERIEKRLNAWLARDRRSVA